MENNNDKDNLKLTEKQRKLVSDNHNLIYWYAYKNNLSIDDYYDILAIGLCKAAKHFDETKGAFSTLGYISMQNAVNTYWKSLKNKSNIPQSEILYYHAQSTIGDMNFLEMISDCSSLESVDYDIMLSEFTGSLTDKEKDIVDMLIDGMKHSEIANELSCSRQNVDYYVRIIREKFNSYLNK